MLHELTEFVYLVLARELNIFLAPYIREAFSPGATFDRSRSSLKGGEEIPIRSSAATLRDSNSVSELKSPVCANRGSRAFIYK